jgi:hypothetical protein
VQCIGTYNGINFKAIMPNTTYVPDRDWFDFKQMQTAIFKFKHNHMYKSKSVVSPVSEEALELNQKSSSVKQPTAVEEQQRSTPKRHVPTERKDSASQAPAKLDKESPIMTTRATSSKEPTAAEKQERSAHKRQVATEEEDLVSQTPAKKSIDNEAVYRNLSAALVNFMEKNANDAFREFCSGRDLNWTFESFINRAETSAVGDEVSEFLV